MAQFEKLMFSLQCRGAVGGTQIKIKQHAINTWFFETYFHECQRAHHG